MRHVLQAATDAGMVVLFDPAVLPEDYDALGSRQPATLKDLGSEGRMVLLELYDGTYVLHLHVDEDLPDHLRPLVTDPEELPSFPVPSGRLYFTGAEHAFHSDDSWLKKHPSGGGVTEVPAGTWDLTLYRREDPEDDEDGVPSPSLTPEEKRANRLLDALGVLFVPSILYCIVTFLFLPWKLWFLVGLPAPVLVCLSVWLLGRTAVYRSAEAKEKQSEREHPAVIAVLKTPKEGTAADRSETRRTS